MTILSNPYGARAIALDQTCVFHSWSKYGQGAELAIAGGLGSTVWDYEGTTYLDFSSQLVNVNVGHQHKGVIDAIKLQLEKLCTVAPAHANLVRGEAAQRILDRAGEQYAAVFFTNGGADANENAMRLARLATRRSKILSTYKSYHGNTGAAIAATGDWRRIPNDYSNGHVHFFGPFPYRSEFWSRSVEEEAERALAHLRRVVESEGPDTVAAIILETIPGTAGIIMPPPGYLSGVRALCDQYGIILIADEVMCGFGRAGTWFAHKKYAMNPDLITFAKGVNSGYVPVGGVILSEEISNEFREKIFPGGLTYSGHPLAAASIVGALDAMQAEGIVENARLIGEQFLGPGLADLAGRHEIVGDVRGAGVFWALDLVSDRCKRTPLAPAEMVQLKCELISHGLLPFISENRVHVVPPCVVTPAEVADALGILDRALGTLKPGG